MDDFRSEGHARESANGLVLVLADLAQHRRGLPPPLRAQSERLATHVRVVAHAHERYDPAAPLPAQDFLSEVCADADALRGTSPLRLQFEAEPVPIEFAHAVPLGLVVTELVANAYDHGFRGRTKGALSVRLQSAPRARGRLVVADTGPGLPLPFVKGPGLNIVESLVASMERAVMYSPGPGTQVEVMFPAWRAHRPTPAPDERRVAAAAGMATITVANSSVSLD